MQKAKARKAKKGWSWKKTAAIAATGLLAGTGLGYSLSEMHHMQPPISDDVTDASYVVGTCDRVEAFRTGQSSYSACMVTPGMDGIPFSYGELQPHGKWGHVDPQSHVKLEEFYVYTDEHPTYPILLVGTGYEHVKVIRVAQTPDIASDEDYCFNIFMEEYIRTPCDHDDR